jgi:hypothetical protein
MGNDLALADLDIPQAVRDKLAELAVGGVRQFHARLRREGPVLREYLKLSPAAFAALSRLVEDVVRKHFPDDLALKIHPAVNKTGVAVHRLKNRPHADDAADSE